MSQSDPAFEEFYAVYLAHHRHPVNRALHLLAKLLAIAAIVAAAVERSALLLLAVPVLAVAPCWLGHLLAEGNRPVSWKQPSASLLGTLLGWLRRPPRHRPAPAGGGRAYYSFLADLRMCGEFLARKDPPRVSSEPT